MIYLEIIELKFCKLNKNTKKSIQIRERNDSFLIDTIRNSIDE